MLVNDITVVPADTAETIPVALMVATEGTVLLHTPPVIVSVSVSVPPRDVTVNPVITPTGGNGLTVIG